MRELRTERKHGARLEDGKFCQVAAIGAAVAIGGSMMSANAQSDAADTAAGAQVRSAELGAAESRYQFDAVRRLLEPYVNSGSDAMAAQRDLVGLNGGSAQHNAIMGLEGSPMFTSLLKRGENSILSNASATGGLRGGNVQGALAQFSPQLLAQMIEAQYGRLGGLTSLGQNAAAGVGNAGMQTGNAVSALLQQSGAAQAGAALAGGRAQSQMISGIAGGIGQFAGAGGFGGSTAPNYSGYTPPTSGPGGSYADNPFQVNDVFM